VAALWPLGVIGEVENAELRRAIAAGRRRVASGGAG
jgi:hypothetical protein